MDSGLFYKVKARKMTFHRPGGSVAVIPNKKMQERGATHSIIGQYINESPNAYQFRVSGSFVCIIAKADMVKVRKATGEEIANGIPEYAPTGDNVVNLGEWRDHLKTARNN